MTLYDTEALTKLAVATFTRSGDLAIRQYYKTLAAYNSGLLGGKQRALMDLSDRRELLIGHAVVRPRVVCALLLLEVALRVPHQRHV